MVESQAPAAYVRVRCYPPARVSNFVKDFLAGAYDQTSKESKHVFGFCFLDGVAMLLFGVLNVKGIPLNEESGYFKKWRLNVRILYELPPVLRELVTGALQHWEK